jgi:prepilin-type N-terminal cleavage/methylation domain-containing protein
MARGNKGVRGGFTLVETMVAVVVASLIMAIGVPRFLGMREGLKLDGAAYQLAGDLRRAQIEAVKRNRTVELLKTGASTYSIQSVPPLLDPLQPVIVFYARSFEPDVTFDAGAMSVRMASFGPPVSGAATFTINHAGRSKTTTVSANGLVTVQ